MIRLKRVYEAPSPEDGMRILVDRLWPRGIAKDSAKIDLWVRDLAPSTEARASFSHDPQKWDEFKKRYFAELEDNRDSIAKSEKEIAGQLVTFVFAAKETEHNNAVALKVYVEGRRNG